MSASSLSRARIANPLAAIDRRSPPLPFTASTRTDSPVNGSGRVNFELVLPPPKLVMRRSAPRRFDRYLRSSSGSLARFPASLGSQRFRRYRVEIDAVSGTGELHVLF